MNKVEMLRPGGEKMRTFGEAYAGVRQSHLMNGSVKAAEKLFGNAKSEIKIVCVRLNSKFYSNPRIIRALIKAADKASITIICGPEVDENSSKIFDLCKTKKVDIWQTQKWPEVHYSVVDRRGLRLEEPHPHDKFSHNSHVVTISHGPSQAEELLKDFEELKKNAAPTCFPKRKPMEYNSSE